MPKGKQVLIGRRSVAAALLVPPLNLALGRRVLAQTSESTVAKPPCTKATVADIADQVRKILVEHLGVDAAKVTPGAEFIKDLGADSLDTCELVMAFEEKFSMEIPDEAAEKMVTVQDSVNYITGQLCHSGS